MQISTNLDFILENIIKSYMYVLQKYFVNYK